MTIEIQDQPSRNSFLHEIGPSIEAYLAYYHHMRETEPVHYRPKENLWEVFQYQDVQQVLLDHANFSMSLPETFPSTLGKSDPPHHRQLRGLVSQAFTPRSIEALTSRVVKIVDELLELALANKKMDVVSDLTYPLPVRVIGEMLGLPAKDQERFRAWSYDMLGQLLGTMEPDYSDLDLFLLKGSNELKTRASSLILSRVKEFVPFELRFAGKKVKSVTSLALIPE